MTRDEWIKLLAQIRRDLQKSIDGHPDKELVTSRRLIKAHNAVTGIINEELGLTVSEETDDADKRYQKLSGRLLSILDRNGIRSSEEIEGFDERDLRRLPLVGNKAIKEIRDAGINLMPKRLPRTKEKFVPVRTR